MNLKINNRLQKIGNFIYPEDKVIDIGCDHGLLGIYLVLNRNVSQMVSSDINEMPLNKAKKNIEKYHLEDRIETKLGNGIECVSNNLDTMVISGMGGLTINEILKDIKKCPNIKKIIVSPNNEFVKTRKSISKLGFSLDEEVIVFENSKYYLISCYLKKKRKLIDYYFGKLDFKDIKVRNYYQSIIEKNIDILSNLNRKHFLKKIKLKYINYVIKKKLEKN